MTLRIIFKNVFPADGYNVENETLNGLPLTEESYILDNKTLLTTFLGLPNRQLSPGADQSFKNLLKNFIGWRDSSRLFVNLLILPFMTAWNIVLTPCKFLLNITKFVTEFIPLTLCHNLIASAAAAAIGYTNADSPGMRRLSLAKLIGSYSGLFFGGMLYFVGAAITSPATNLRNSYGLGRMYGTSLLGPSLGMLNGILAGLGALATTVTVYSLLFPLAINFFATTVIPVLPGALAAVIDKVAMGLNVVFKPLSFLSDLFNLIDPVAVATPAALGFSAVAGLTATIAGKKLGEWSERFKNAWHRGNSLQVANVEELPPEEPQDHPQPANQPISAYRGTSFKLEQALVAAPSPAANVARISLVDDSNPGGLSNGQPSQQAAPQPSASQASAFFQAATSSVDPAYNRLAQSSAVASASTEVPGNTSSGMRR